MSDFENLTFPHIRYISGPQKKDSKNLFYMGGEPDVDLIVGKEYTLCYAFFSPNRETKRKYVWYIKVDKTHYNVSLKNFGTIAELRDKKINQILE